MDTQDGLFDFAAEPQTPTPALIERMPATDEQVSQLRQSLSDAGLEDQVSRKNALESAAGRQLRSLRDLFADEVHEVARRLAMRGSRASTPTGSAWDTREEDTWIDRL
ncbi:hypothetical protein [Galactobacter valiniphilus]|uniref:hypothetical protein n=1 Tax=Galactobacter valiniphilus TaxID=2676122 RepID=UPI003735F44E